MFFGSLPWLCFNYASLFFRHSMQSATTWTKDTGEYIIQILQLSKIQHLDLKLLLLQKDLEMLTLDFFIPQ